MIKFFHILIALSLTGTVIYSLTVTKGSSSQKTLHRLNITLLILCPLAILTGTFLVLHHYTFHVAWIQAAYFLISVFALITILFIVFKEKITKKWVQRLIYSILLILLIMITHDAVTKDTFFKLYL